MKSNIPVTSLQRLPIYLNYLKSIRNTSKNISSGAIARALEMGEVLVRKDLAYTSAEGKTRVGYDMEELISGIEEYLGCNEVKAAAIVGVGELGCALMSYGGFANYGIDIVAGFDNNPQKIDVGCAGKPVYDIANFEYEAKRLNIRLAVICVPASHAQSVCDLLVESGVKAILNFAPILLKTPAEVNVRNVDLAANLAILSSTLQ